MSAQPRGESLPPAEDRAGNALFVMPRSPKSGQVGIWTMAAGWASAMEALGGSSWLLTLDGVMDPMAAVALATEHRVSSPGGGRWKRAVPTMIKTGLKDLREYGRARTFSSSLPTGDWESHELAFVWQRHDLFHDAGHELARELGVPLVLCVDAPVVWEARRWGVRRPGWSRLLEAIAENPLFEKADLIAAVSEEVAEQVRMRGVPSSQVLVTPNGVDIHRFDPGVDPTPVRRRHGIEGRFVVGWAGGFHRFHSLDLAIEMAAELETEIPEMVLLLVGDGVDRVRLERKVAELGLDNVIFTGSVDHTEMPAHLTAMDVALVLGPGDGRFHYSPLKLREYMSCGVPVVATRVGELASAVRHGKDGLTVDPGSSSSLADAIRSLHDDPQWRASQGEEARSKMVSEGSWDVQVMRVQKRLGEIREATATSELAE